MAILYDENDTPIEALTLEELEEEKNSWKEEIGVSKLEEQLKEKEKEIQELKEKAASITGNFSGLRKKTEIVEKEKDDLLKKLEEVDSKANQAFNLVKESTLDSLVSEFTTDAETAKKVKHWYGTFAGEPANDEEKAQRVKNAFLLATASDAQKEFFNSNVISNTGAYSRPTAEKANTKLSDDNAVGVAKALGLTDAELKEAGLI